MFVTFLMTALAWGQSIYNPLLPTWKPPAAGFSGGVSLDLDLDQGNVEQTKISGSAAGELVTATDEMRLTLRGKHQLASGDLVAQEVFGHLRLTRRVQGPWHVVTFIQASSNPFKSQSLRALTGTGMEWRIYPSDRTRVSLALTAMAEIDDYASGVVDDDEGLRARASAYAVVATRLSTNASTGFVVFAQPRLDQPANQRGSVDAFFSVEVVPKPKDGETKVKGSLTWALELDWDTRPPAGVEPLDVGVKAGIGVSWS